MNEPQPIKVAALLLYINDPFSVIIPFIVYLIINNLNKLLFHKLRSI